MEVEKGDLPSSSFSGEEAPEVRLLSDPKNDLFILRLDCVLKSR